MTWAARLIEQDFDTAYNLRGEGETIQRWLSALPAGLVRSRPRLLLAQAQLRGTSGHLADMEQLIDAAERVSANGSGEPFEPTAGPAASLLVNVPAHIALERAYLAQLRGDAEGTAAFSSRALAESRPGESLLTCTVQGFLAVAEWLRGRLAEAEGAFTSGVAGWRAAQENGLGAGDEPRYASEPEHLVLARVLLAQGQPGRALALLDRLYAAAVTQDRTGSAIEAGRCGRWRSPPWARMRTR